MSVNVLYTASAPATGGRDGEAATKDGSFKVKLSTPKELGGAGGPGSNPEQLFASGCSACFIGAMKFVSSRSRSDPGRHLGHRDGRHRSALEGGFGLGGNAGRLPSRHGQGRRAKAGRGSRSRLPVFELDPEQRRREAERRLTRTSCAPRHASLSLTGRWIAPNRPADTLPGPVWSGELLCPNRPKIPRDAEEPADQPGPVAGAAEGTRHREPYGRSCAGLHRRGIEGAARPTSGRPCEEPLPAEQEGRDAGW